MVCKTGLVWQGWQEVGVNLKPFLESPAKMQRSVIHWGGDENQKIDFPIKAIDIGVAKRGGKFKNSGEVKLRQISFIE